MQVSERPTRLSAPLAYALLGALGLALFVPRLGTFGFWDPYEIHIADAARNLVQGGTTLAQATHQLGRPPAVVALVAAGFKIVGIGELGGRLPIALTSVLVLLACFYAGTGLIRRRGALFGSFVLATTPAVLLGARQLTTNAPLLLGAALALGGLARLVWPADDAPPPLRPLHGLVGVAGLVLGQYAGGVLVGVIAPLATIAIALAAAAPQGPRTPWALATGGVATLLLTVAGWIWGHPSPYSPYLGGLPHAFLNSTVFTTVLKQIGFGLFPWVALLPMAAIHALSSTTSDEAPSGRDWFGRVALVTWFVVLYCAATLQAAGVQELMVPAAPALMLLVGAYLDDVLDSGELQPFAGLTVALGAIIIGRDFYVQPESYVGAHMLETLRWPGPLTSMPYLMISYAAFVGGALGLAIGFPLSRRGDTPKQRSSGRLVLVGGAVAASLAMALLTAHYLVPQCSKHLSSKELYGKTKQLDPNAPIGQYHFNASGSSYYSGGRAPVTLASVADVFKFLGRPERVFVMAGAEELPSIDQYAKQQHLGYYVVDDSSARYIMLSNRLGPGERDLNPLRRFITQEAPRSIPHPVQVNFDNKVELIGWDAPASIAPRQDFKLRLYFKVLAPLGGSYKVFVHIDGGGTRINGDHVPLEGKFPTQYWVPGTYITDEHLVSPGENNTGGAPPGGFYQIYMGLYSGAQRLKVVSGPNDGDNRARLGGMRVR